MVGGDHQVVTCVPKPDPDEGDCEPETVVYDAWSGEGSGVTPEKFRDDYKTKVVPEDPKTGMNERTEETEPDKEKRDRINRLLREGRLRELQLIPPTPGRPPVVPATGGVRT